MFSVTATCIFFLNFASFVVFIFFLKKGNKWLHKSAAILHESYFKKIKLSFTELKKKVNVAQTATPNMFLFEFCSAVAEF